MKIHEEKEETKKHDQRNLKLNNLWKDETHTQQPSRKSKIDDENEGSSQSHQEKRKKKKL